MEISFKLLIILDKAGIFNDDIIKLNAKYKKIIILDCWSTVLNLPTISVTVIGLLCSAALHVHSKEKKWLIWRKQCHLFICLLAVFYFLPSQRNNNKHEQNDWGGLPDVAIAKVLRALVLKKNCNFIFNVCSDSVMFRIKWPCKIYEKFYLFNI